MSYFFSEDFFCLVNASDGIGTIVVQAASAIMLCNLSPLRDPHLISETGAFGAHEISRTASFQKENIPVFRASKNRNGFCLENRFPVAK